MNTNLPFKAPGLKSSHDSALSLYTWIAPEKLPIQQLRTKQYSMYIYFHCESALKKSSLPFLEKKIIQKPKISTSKHNTKDYN